MPFSTAIGETALSSHPELATAFRDGVWSGALPPGVTAREPDEVERRFAIYRNNVAHSLTEALAARFPVVQRLVGETFFRALARLFNEEHPPASPVLLSWGGAFPEFLEGFPPVAGLPYLPDVARLELARGGAYHAADAEPLPPEGLAQAAQDPAGSRLELHPSVQLIASRFPVVSIWRTNQLGETPAPLKADQAETALVLRDRAFEVPVQAIGPGDAAFVQGLRDGATLLACAAAAARVEPGHDPGPLLARLAQAGAFITSNKESQP